jgi:lysophospholipase L1-like esterase
MKFSGRSWLKTCRTVFLLTGAGVLSCEVGVRIYERIRYGAPWADYDFNRTLWVRDKTAQIGRPHARFRDITLNSLGLRGPELRFGTTRIVCIGASETFGLYESSGKEYPRQLEQLLNQGNAVPKYDVLNWSHAGAKLDSFATQVPGLVARAHPVMAILYPSPVAYIEPSQPQAKTPPPQRFRSARYALSLFNSIAPIQVKSLVYRTWIWLQQRGRPPLSAIPSEWYLRLHSDLQQLISNLRQAGVEPVLLTHATPFGSRLDDYDRALLINWRRFYPEVTESALLEMETRGNESIRNVAQQERIHLLDVSEYLRGCRGCFVDFVHFNDSGAARVAAYLKSSIEAELSQRRQSASRPIIMMGQ